MILFSRNDTHIPKIVGVLLLVISASVRFLALNQTPYANGWDGYYYVMQTHSFLELGHLQSSDYSLIYPYFILLSFIISDYELAFKIGTAILSALFTYSSFRITYLFSKRNLYLAVLVGVLTIFSPGITFFASQFPKNLLGVIFITWVPLFIQRKQYPLVVLFVILSALTHRMTGGLGILFLCITLLSNIPKKYVIICLCLLTLISFLPGIFHISDFERFSGQLSNTLQFAPVEFLNIGITRHQIIWQIEVYFSTLLSVFIFCYIVIQAIRLKKLPSKRIMILTLIIIIFFPFFKISPGSMGYRFFLLIFLLYPILLGGLLMKLKVPTKITILISGILIIGSFYSYKSYNPHLHDAPNALYHQMANEIIKTYSAEEYSLIIAHKSLAEVLIFKTDFDALNWTTPENLSKSKVLRIVEGIPFRFIIKYIDRNDSSKILQLNTLYFVLPETIWYAMIEKAEEEKDVYLLDLIHTSNNPMKPRPYYLKKGKKYEKVYSYTLYHKYRKGGDKFKRVAHTLAKSLAKTHTEVMCQSVESKRDIKALFKNICAEGSKIHEFHFIGHSGMYGPMYGTIQYPEQFSPFEIEELQIPFTENAEAYFHCCRSARWFAPYFARTKGVKSHGYHWYTAFSTKKDYYKIDLSKDINKDLYCLDALVKNHMVILLLLKSILENKWLKQ